MRLVYMTAGIALLMQAAASAAATLRDGVLACSGERTSEGYPYGRQEHGREYHLLQLSEGKLFKRSGLVASELCDAGTSKCSVVTEGGTLTLSMSNIPQRDFSYSETLSLDRKSGRFLWTGGGLDGGWRLVGKCRRAD